MRRFGSLLLSFVVVAGVQSGCAEGPSPGGTGIPVEEVSPAAEEGAGEGAATAQEEDALHAGTSRPGLGGFTQPGFCDDLKLVLGATADSEGRVGVPGVVSCFISYGVDSVAVWGPARAGYPTGMAHTPSAQINGHQVGVMDVEISGPRAAALFARMARTWSVYRPDHQRASPYGHVFCEKPANQPAHCVLRGFVGFETQPVYW